jgi:putative drug exporter of the RND superfamily
VSELLARMARALTQRWKRGLAVALIAVFAIGALAANAERPADDFSVPDTESQTAGPSAAVACPTSPLRIGPAALTG